VTNADTVFAALDRLFVEATADQIPDFLGRLETVKARAWMGGGAQRDQRSSPSALPAADRNIDAKEAARRLGMSRSYVYRHADEFPFTRRIGGRVLFWAAGLEEWNRERRQR